jgi:hypothetical protein
MSGDHRAAARDRSPALMLIASLAGVLVLALLLANEEVQIEGGDGWAANLPTWRIEGGWLLEVFWGGRPMTGYHVYIFSFVALFFHFPFAFFWRWSWRSEARALASIALFWVSEDFLWFLVNPAFGWAKFAPSDIPWHHHWLLGAPTDYWLGLLACALFGAFSARAEVRPAADRGR